MIDQKAILAENIRAFRMANQLNQYEFAEECGLNKDTISLIERGKLNTTLDTLDLLAVRMDTKVTELLKSSHEIEYILISKEITINEITTVTYGIGAVKDNELIHEFHDISLNRNKVKTLVEDFNINGFMLTEFRQLEEYCD